MNSKLIALKNDIHVKNEYNKIAAPILEQIKEACKPFIGKKINTLKGFSSKFSEATKFNRETVKVNPIPGRKWASVHYVGLRNSYNDLSVEISLCFSVSDTSCEYEKRSWYFGKTDDNGVLISINDGCKVDGKEIDFDTELKAIQKYLELQKIAESAKDKITLYSDYYKHISIEDITG